MNCIYNKVRTKKYKKYIYCTKQRKIIQYSNCKGCPYKEYKVKEQKQMKQRTSKQTKLERDRFSLFTDNMSKCYFCPNKKNHTHEIFCGRNRQNSMKYGLCLPICWKCHEKYQNDSVFNKEWHIRGQIKFNEIYPDLRFEDIF